MNPSAAERERRTEEYNRLVEWEQPLDVDAMKVVNAARYIVSISDCTGDLMEALRACLATTESEAEVEALNEWFGRLVRKDHYMALSCQLHGAHPLPPAAHPPMRHP